MPRFSGTPVEQAAPAKGPRFGGKPVEEPGFFDRLGASYMRGRQQLKPYQDQAVSDLVSPGKALQSVDDMARIGIDTASFGFADPAIGYLTGEDERAKTQAARDRAGWAGTGMDVATAIAATPSLAGRAVSTAKGVLPTIGRWLGYGAEGAGQAALSSYGHGERDVGKIKDEALMGAGLGVAGQAVGNKAGTWLERRKAAAAQPFKSADEVKAASKRGYKEVDRSGAHYPMSDTDTLLQDLDSLLLKETATPGLDDRAIAAVERLKRDWQGKPINPTELDKVRRWVDRKLIGSNPRGPDADLGFKLKDQIDAFTGKTNPIDPVTGQSNAQVNRTLDEARSLRARAYRSKDVERAEEKAVKQAKRTGSSFLNSGNLENTRRQQFDKLSTRIEEGRTGGYSPDERDAIKQIASGTKARDLGRAGSVVSPFRGGLPALLHLGLGPLSGGLSTAVGIGGEIASKIGKRATGREISDLAAVVRDPSGKGLSVDPDVIQQYRDMMAKLMVGGQRSGGAR